MQHQQPPQKFLVWQGVYVIALQSVQGIFLPLLKEQKVALKINLAETVFNEYKYKGNY